MASASALGWILPLTIGGSVAAAGLSVAHIDIKDLAVRFATGPGRTSRILLALFIAANWKSMPFMWTYRVLAAITRQWLPPLRPARLHPRHLFHFSITSSYNTLLETDYNLHKSNSTYFADLDVSRSHCVTHLLKPGMDALAANGSTSAAHPAAVRTPDGQPARGGLGIGLGAVFCSFKREVAIGQGYELWTRILAWDRKWVYFVSYFVVKGKVKPRAWDNGTKRWFGPLRKTEGLRGSGQQDGEGLEKYVIATAVSKYVFKIGRFTVHPAILLEQSGLLPAREGGWIGGENDVWDEVEVDDVQESRGEGEDEWTWERTEAQRREGMKFASKFAGLDGLSGVFDGGEEGALGRFYPG